MFGTIRNPFAPSGFNVSSLNNSTQGQGLIIIISNLVRLSIVIAGLYSLINIILAGYGYMSAGGDTKLVQKSTERIWRSFVGLLIVAGSVLLAMMIGWLVFSDAGALINPRIYAP